ncbi:hypothetical protein OHA37_00780 [Streptomyces sp. NBC_00335]|uniref:hypothetical protein n=1 Tax=unclassified Streptomyces TaxID=2593676 RepID=UPI0022516C96|nr:MULTISPECIES: hypothetical protein [unclassified Streptomyces]MCX5402420.1 hypothetical protein [Streptomyces sp. NBC_00086]
MTPQAEPLMEDVDVVTAADPSCQPLADLRSGKPRHVAVGTAWTTVEPPGGDAAGSVVLTSYAAGEAKEKLREVKRALGTCNELEASSQRGWSERVDVKALPTEAVGNESASFSLTSPLQSPGKEQVMTLVRTGNTLAVYMIPPDGNVLPVSLMKEQHEKLQGAG